MALSAILASPAGMKAEDMGNGCYSNPVIWADVPDPDVIRVGDTFYMVSTTMHLMPGAPVMKSKDLVNWELASYIFHTLSDNEKYDLKGGNVYGRGQWATSLKYHDDKFYALFSPNDEPFRAYIYTTENASAEGSWKLVSRTPHFHDSSLFFDDDGRVYVTSGSGDIVLTELKSDLSDVKEDGIRNFSLNLRDEEETGLHEGSRLIKHNGKYYLMIISWPKNKPRRQLCYRADKITGPYTKKVVLEDNFAGFGYVGQGTIVDDPYGNWWGMIFQDRGGVGRVLTLSPVKWVDGWPMIGDENGRIPAVYPKPSSKKSVHALVASDNFDGKLRNEWEWNHNPDCKSFSLTARKGWLRLATTDSGTKTLYHARNTISQRMEGPLCRGTVKIDASHMKPGDKAGFAAFNGHSGVLTIHREDDGYSLIMSSQQVNFGKNHDIAEVKEDVLSSVAIPSGKEKEIYLKIDADFNLGKDMAEFSYSYDGKNWNKIGEPYKMRFDFQRLFMGTRMAIFNYATSQKGGYIDCDYFDYSRIDNPVNLADNFIKR